MPGLRGRVDCQLKNIQTQPNQYVWKLGDQVLQTGTDYTVEVNAMFFGSQTTILYIESSPAVDTSYTCIADWGGDTTVSTSALLDIISITPTNIALEEGQTASNVVLSCVVSGWTTELNKCNQVSWVDIGQSYSPAPVYTDNYKSELTITTSTVDQTFTCRCARSVVDNIDVPVYLDFVVSVQWRDSSGQVLTSDHEYTIDQGTKDESGNQYSTLQISTTKLQTLGSTSVTYTCQVLSGDLTVAVTKTMTLTLHNFGGVSRTSVEGMRGRVDCQLKNIKTAPNQYIWKLGDQILQTGTDYTIEVNAMFFGSQTTCLYIESSPAVDTNYTCIADWGGDKSVSTSVLLDIISIEPKNVILEQDQQTRNLQVEQESDIVLSCVVSGWTTELNKCNQVSWVDIGQNYSPAPVYTDNYKAELTITTSTVDQTFTCRCARSVVVDIDVFVSMDLIVVTLEDRHAAMSGDVLLTCSITQLLNTVSVQWRDSSGQVLTSDHEYTIDQGTKDESGNQYSTLQISTTKLQALGSTSVTYTCQVLSGDLTVAVSKTMTLTLYDFNGVSRTSLAGSKGRVDCQIKSISTAPNQYVWKLGDQVLQTGTDYTVQVNAMFFGSQTTILYIESSPAVDTSYTCIADWGGEKSVSTTALLDIISITPANIIMEEGQSASNIVLSCVVSGWVTELNKCNQVSWVDIGQDYSPAPVYTDNYKAELTITTSTVDQTFTCRCARSVVDNIDVPVYLDFVAVTIENRHAAMSGDVLLTCSITKLLNTVSVQWKDSSGQVIDSESDYSVNQGTKDDSGNQYSTLQISTSKLQTLGSTSVTYTCQVLSGDQTVAVSKTMTLTLYDFNGVSRTSLAGSKGRVDCQIKSISTAPNQYVWKLGDQVLQTGTDYTVQVNAMFFGSQTTILYIESSPAVDTSYTCIADWGGEKSVSTTALLDIINITPTNIIMEKGQTASNVVLSCVVSGWTTELNKCNQVSWVDIGQDYSPAPVYTDNYKAELTITTSTVDQTFTCRCARSVVDNIDVTVYLDFVGVVLEDSYAAKGTDALLTCSITQLLNTVSVQWRDSIGQVIDNDSDYTVNQGTRDGSGNQYSTLQISTTKLQTLGSTSVTYTCQVLSGDQTVAVSKTMTLTLYEFGAKITPGLADIYTTGDHVISCLLEYVPEQQTGIQWAPANQQPGKYDLNDGNLVDNSQVSTLTISKSHLKTLMGSSKSHTFTCEVIFGSSASPFTATQTVTIYDPSVVLSGPGVVSDIVPVTLSCVISDIYKAGTVTWYGGDLSSSGVSESTAKYTLLSGAYDEINHVQVHRIVISTAALDAIGSTSTFTCLFDPADLNVPISAELSLTVISPVITLHPTSTSIKSGDALTLSCKGTGVNPDLIAVSCFWSHNDGNVDPSLITTTSVTNSVVESKLEFPYIESGMSGDYKCGIDYGGAKLLSQAATIVVVGMISFPSSSLVVAGHSLTISMVTLTPSSARTVGWFKNSFPLDESDSSVTVTTVETLEGSNKKTTSTLKWEKVKTISDGTSIHAELASDELYLKSSPTLVKVLEIYTQPTDYPLLRGIDMYVYCAFEGPPQPSISWLSHTSPTSAGVEVVYGVVKTTVLNPTPTLTVYQSRLTLNVEEGEDPLYLSCRATYPSLGSIFSGGTLTTRAAGLSLIGISSLSGPSDVAVGVAATFTATADYPPEPHFQWTFNDKVISLGKSTGTRVSSTKFKYVFIKENMQVVDSGSYGVVATYSEYGTSASKSITVRVKDTCPLLTEPDNGQLTCSPSTYTTALTAACTVTCNNGYSLHTSKSVFSCTDGVWEQNSITNPLNHVTKCLRTVAPSSYTLTVSARYQLPWVASCSDYYGDYLRLAFPYLVAGANPACVSDGDCYLNDDYFSYSEPSDACFTIGNSVWLKAQYVQNRNTAVDKRSEMFSQITEYLGSVNFDPFALMKAANCVGSCDCCILDTCIKASNTIMSRLKCSSYDRRKRATKEEQDFQIQVLSGLGSAREVAQLLETSCTIGSIAWGDKCLVCPVGTYQASDQCVQCPTGTFQELPGSTSCEICPSITSNSVDERSDISCYKKCRMREITFGAITDPPPGTNVQIGDHVTIVCNRGFSYRSKKVYVVQLKSCYDMLSCSKVEIIPSSLDVVEGSRLDLKCKVTSVTRPKRCVYYKDSEKISEIESLSYQNGNFWCTFTLSSTQMAHDEGSYACAAVFAGERFEYSNNTSIRLLQLQFYANSTELKEGTSHSFRCTATVPRDSRVTISWIKNGVPIGERVTSTTNSVPGFLNFTDVTLEDQGEYNCVATFLGIGLHTSEPVIITVFGLVKGLNDLALLEGTSTTLICKPSIGEVSWTFNSVPLTNDSTSLIITSADSKDTGIYKCTASYEGDTIVSTGRITVSTTGISVHPEDKTLKLGESVTLTCDASENATFSWHVDHTAVYSGITSSLTRSTIELLNVTTRSTVHCVVTTTDGGSYKSRIATLNVISFSESPRSKAIVEGEVITLRCSITCEGIVGVHWMRTDGQKTIPESQVETTNDGRVARSVMITGEEGVYFCSALCGDDLVVDSNQASLTKVLVTFSNSPAALGDNATLTCSFKGASNLTPDTVYWVRNGEIIFIDDNIRQEPHTKMFRSYLQIISINVNQAGTYECVFFVSSDLSQYKSEPTPIKLLGFVDLLPDIVARKGQPVNCTYIIRYHDSLKVKCQVSHGEIDVVAGDIMDDIIFYRVGVFNVGEMVQEVRINCTAHYKTNTTIRSETSHIFYLGKPTLKSNSSSVLVGEVAVITLTADFVYKPPTVHWTVNGVKFPQFNEYNSGNTHSSVLYHTVAEDTKISAMVLHSDIQVNSTVETFVKAFGVLGVAGQSIAYMTDSFNLTCKVAVINDKNTSVSWFHGTTKLEPHSSILQDDILISAVFISDFSKDDIGIYTCKAQFSDDKNSEKSINLTKSDACKAPITENTVVNITLETVPHMGAIEVQCRENHVVLRCKSGIWDQLPPECPSLDKNMPVFLAISSTVLTILLIVSISHHFYKRLKTASLNRELVVGKLKEWSGGTTKPSILKQPNSEKVFSNRRVRFVTQ
ncbi:hypothetical protein ACHWQZ_G005188 [Mnemiopsis leidyi]